MLRVDGSGHKTMLCYLMKDGQIHGVVMLEDGADEELIEQAEVALKAHAGRGIEGVEVWDGTRFVYCSPYPAESN